MPAFNAVAARAVFAAEVSSCAGAAGAGAAIAGAAGAGSADEGGFIGVQASARGLGAFTPLALAMPSNSS